MQKIHQDLMVLLVACQVATLEHANEQYGVVGASDALFKRIKEALELAKKLKKDDERL